MKSEAGTSSPDNLNSSSSRRNTVGHKKQLWTRLKLVSRLVAKSKKKKKTNEAEESVADEHRRQKAEQQEAGNRSECERVVNSTTTSNSRDGGGIDPDLNESFVTFKGLRVGSTFSKKWSKLTKNGAGNSLKTPELSMDVGALPKLQRFDGSKTVAALPSTKNSKFTHRNQTMLFQPGASDTCPVSPVSFLPSDSEDLKSQDSEVKSTGRVDFNRLVKLGGISRAKEESFRDHPYSQPPSYTFNGIKRPSTDEKFSANSTMEGLPDGNEYIPRKDRVATMATSRLSRSPQSYQPGRQSLRQIFQSGNASTRRSYARASKLLAGLDRQRLSRRTSSVPKDIRLKDTAPESQKFRKTKKVNADDLQSPWGVKAPSFSSSDSGQSSSLKFRVMRLTTSKKQVKANKSDSFNFSDDDSDDYVEVANSTPIVMLQDEFVNYTVKTMKKAKGKGRRMSSL